MRIQQWSFLHQLDGFIQEFIRMVDALHCLGQRQQALKEEERWKPHPDRCLFFSLTTNIRFEGEWTR